jgi:hypothetical protein
MPPLWSSIWKEKKSSPYIRVSALYGTSERKKYCKIRPREKEERSRLTSVKNSFSVCVSLWVRSRVLQTEPGWVWNFRDRIAKTNLHLNLNIDSSASSYTSFQITVFALPGRMRTTHCISIVMVGNRRTNQLKKLRGLGPLANYADRANGSCWRSSANFCG